MKIAIGCDHAGPELKAEILAHLDEKGVEYTDFGIQAGEKVDYPDKAKEVCEKVASGEYEMGILICGTGIGMSMSANKIKGIRAACCSDYFSAKYTRAHNDANVLCIGARVLGGLSSWWTFSLKRSLRVADIRGELIRSLSWRSSEELGMRNYGIACGG